MKKFILIVLICIFMPLLTACNESNNTISTQYDKYDELINCIVELQDNDINAHIVVEGKRRSSSITISGSNGKYELGLYHVIVTNNCLYDIDDNYGSYYFLFTEIESVSVDGQIVCENK